MEVIFADYDLGKLTKIQKINLQNFYKHKPNKRVIRCLICEVDIKENDVYNHTVCSKHIYNKLFYKFVQDRNQVGTVDFITLNKNWVRCRYCINELIPNSYDHINNHIRTVMHLQTKQSCLDKVSQGGKIANIKPVMKATNTCNTTFAMSSPNKAVRVSDKRQLGAIPKKIEKNNSKVVSGIQSTSGAIEKLSLVQPAAKTENSSVKTSAPIMRAHEVKSPGVCRKSSARSNTEVLTMIRKSTVYPPSQANTYSYNPYTDDSYGHTNRNSNYTSRSSVNEENLLSPWAWIGIGCAAIALTYLKSSKK